jgi:hypothetical protein
MTAETHCPRRHPYDEANTRVDRNGWRHCRRCRVRWQREYEARKWTQMMAAGDA